MFFRDYYFSSGNSRVNRLIALFRCIVGLMRQIWGLQGYTLFFLFLLKNIECDNSLELPWQGGSNKYPQSMF